MAIYEPTFRGTGIYSGNTLGKDAPFYSPIKGYQVKLAGPHSGKIRAAIAAGRYVSNLFKRNPRPITYAGAAGAGYLANASYNQKRKALLSYSSYSNRKRRNRASYARKQHNRRCCSCQCN